MKTAVLILLILLIASGCSMIYQPRRYTLVINGCENTTVPISVTSEHADDMEPSTSAPVDFNIPVTPIP